MDLGFDTIGNATLVCYDRGPVLVTDPWVQGSAYFGSWGLSHAVPEQQIAAIRDCEFVWISHGHPDHLNADSESVFSKKKILLPDHFGGRIARAYREAGCEVTILADRKWHRLSDRIRVFCVADCNQDGILLIDLDGLLLVNLNDARWDSGWLMTVRKVVKGFDRSFVLSLTGHGDTDMINVHDEDGRRVLPGSVVEKVPLEVKIRNKMRLVGATAFIPFSSLHRYQRKDSIWAAEHSVRVDEYPPPRREGNAHRNFPPFVRYSCATDAFEEIRPAPNEPIVHEPEEFGDNWSDELDPDDLRDASRYFSEIEHLSSAWDFIRLRVGGKEHPIDLGRGHGRGLTFEAPRGSLMTAIRAQVFDDLLIGNYMRTTIHGLRPKHGLHPDFTPYVARYADNGGARTKAELKAYRAAYRRRAPLEFLVLDLSRRCKNLVRPGSTTFRMLKRGFYRGLGRGLGRGR